MKEKLIFRVNAKLELINDMFQSMRELGANDEELSPLMKRVNDLFGK